CMKLWPVVFSSSGCRMETPPRRTDQLRYLYAKLFCYRSGSGASAWDFPFRISVRDQHSASDGHACAPWSRIRDHGVERPIYKGGNNKCHRSAVSEQPHFIGIDRAGRCTGKERRVPHGRSKDGGLFLARSAFTKK